MMSQTKNKWLSKQIRAKFRPKPYVKKKHGLDGDENSTVASSWKPSKKERRQMSNMERRSLRSQRSNKENQSIRLSKRPCSTSHMIPRCRTACFGSIRQSANEGVMQHQVTRTSASRMLRPCQAEQTYVAHNRTSSSRCSWNNNYRRRYPTANPPIRRKKRNRPAAPVRKILPSSPCTITVKNVQAGESVQQKWIITATRTFLGGSVIKVGGDDIIGAETNLVVPAMAIGEVLELETDVTMPAKEGVFAVFYRLFVRGEKTEPRICAMFTVLGNLNKDEDDKDCLVVVADENKIDQDWLMV